MAELLSTGATWLSAQMKEHLGTTVTYRRGSDTVSVTATKGNSNHETAGDLGVIITFQTHDYLVNVADLKLNGNAIEPKRGDFVEETAGGKTYRYEVMGDRDIPAWRWSGPYRNKFRIHTKQINVA